MIRNVLCALVIFAASLGVVLAEPVKGKIVKIEGNTITVVTGKKGETQTKEYKAAADVKVTKKEGDEKKEVAGGLSGLKVDAKKGLIAVLEVQDGTVKEITIGGGGKKKKKAS